MWLMGNMEKEMTPQTNPTSDKLDEILAGLSNYIVESIHLQPTPVEMIKLNQRQAKQAIKSLVTKARIDELELIEKRLGKTFFTRERLAELTEEDSKKGQIIMGTPMNNKSEVLSILQDNSNKQ
jgi:hypothetical protein